MNTVLIVDDSSTQREMISNLLIKSGMRVLEAQDGKEAKEKIQANQPDLVVLDIVMPKLNGYEVCRWVKKEPNTEDIPVVICSCKGEEFDHYWGMKQGADAYIVKPFHPAEMLETVKQLLRNRS